MSKNVEELQAKVISEQSELECVKNTNKLHMLITAQVSDVVFFISLYCVITSF
jgi:hypothetical protein